MTQAPLEASKYKTVDLMVTVDHFVLSKLLVDLCTVAANACTCFRAGALARHAICAWQLSLDK